MLISFLRKTYRGLLANKSNVHFLVLLSFLLTFGLVRLITNLQLRGYLPNQDGPVHIHHLVFGIFLLLISGYAGISFWHYAKARHWVAVFFGIGAALTLDEFALWLFLDDVYWAKEGRASIDAVLVWGTIFILGFLISRAHNHTWFERLFTQQSRTRN